MSFPKNLNSEHFLQAMNRIDREGVPPRASIKNFAVEHEGKEYPPKLLISYASGYANGTDLDRGEFQVSEGNKPYQAIIDAGFQVKRLNEKNLKPDIYDYYPRLESFLEQAQDGGLTTSDFSERIYGLNVKASFGQGSPAHIPWISFTKEGQTTSNGIYPVYLFYKDFNHLILAYGVSENTEPSISWPNDVGPSIDEYVQETFGVPPRRYGNSYVCEAYDLSDELNPEQMNRDLYQIVQEYEELFRLHRSDKSDEVKEKGVEYMGRSQNKNQILYGPPGTGKTYSTINEALRILDPTLNTKSKDRKTLKDKFDQYVKKGLIHFVTFHQSFSYEDFVEGLRADTNQNGDIAYTIEPGIFKRACEGARKTIDGITVATAFDEFLQKLEQEDLELTTRTGKSFKVRDSGGATLLCAPEGGKNDRYSANKESIRQVLEGQEPKKRYGLSYVFGIADHIRKQWKLDTISSKNSGPVVLIIDEINRGNISSIFGELITLIEPGKREGKDENLSVTLPYSKESFSVPDNLYIIGTMNTADRSLALLDTALRRRFDFIEMMPDYSVLKDLKDVRGINIPKMLEKINLRIEALYDREHAIGHAFFAPLIGAKVEDRFSMLQNIFQNKVFPLLEEYFFEDWEKIKLVLGDNQKDNQDLAFIVEQSNFSNEELFGNTDLKDIGVDELKSFSRNMDALSDPAAYLAIYA